MDEEKAVYFCRYGMGLRHWNRIGNGSTDDILCVGDLMVEVILKGLRKNKEFGYRESFVIAKFKAGVILRDKGGLFINISNMTLSRKLGTFFKCIRGDENGKKINTIGKGE